MWAEYWAETGSTVAREYTWGLMAYSLGPDYLYIEEMYVRPELRQQGYGLRMVAECVEIARENNKKFLLASVNLSNKTTALSMRSILAAGFYPVRADAGVVWFSLEV